MINKLSMILIACTKTFYFSFRSFRALASVFFFPHHYPLSLAVNESPAVYILSRALDGLWRKNRRSVNRLQYRMSIFLHHDRTIPSACYLPHWSYNTRSPVQKSSPCMAGSSLRRMQKILCGIYRDAMERKSVLKIFVIEKYLKLSN